MGVSIQWARSGPADLTPLLAMIGAVLVLRFVIGLPLTLFLTILAAAAGAAWAAAVQSWGLALPTLAAVAAVGFLSWRTGRPTHS